MADGIRMPVFPLLTATLTDSAAAIALVFAAGEAPWVLFGLWAGKLSDRMDRRRLVQRVVTAHPAPCRHRRP
ncbi:MAG: MFS transporter [bacterium]|nr:MFS transporter [bacterium]MCP5035741.1 MFS transporter [Actinomycetes bacterium]